VTTSALSHPVDSRIPKRLHSLDGLRGIAALVVLFHHSLLTVPTLAAAYFPDAEKAAPGSWEWFLTYTPLHALWMGSEAVDLFFILSGIVLVLPVLRSRGHSWAAYYPRRLIRLYGPVWVAVLFGIVTILLVPRYDVPAFGPWMESLPNAYSLRGLFKDTTLVFGISGRISPLWSLRWEIVFSLLLPLYVWFAARAPGSVWLKFAGVFGLIALASVVGSDELRFLPVFAIGALIVIAWGRFADLAEWATDREWFWPLVLVVGVVLAAVRWELGALGVTTFPGWNTSVVSILGVSLIVLAAAFWGGFRRVLESRVVQWLGTVSFSLYLIHEPIIMTVRTLLVDASPWLGIAISIPVSLVLAHVFAHQVEMRFHNLARFVGGRVDAAVENRRSRA
jgi:peptidoglycan/LPS O-acetylase OafA/YrhL